MKNLALILMSLISLVGYSQQTEQPSIIFEGIAISATEYFIDSTGESNTNVKGEYNNSKYTTNTSYLVKVTRVLKGQEYLDTGYVEVITKLSRRHLNNQGSHGPRYENYYPGMKRAGIFFTEINTVPATLKRETNNNVVVQPYKFRPMKIDLNRYDCYAIIPKGKNFKTKEDLANYLKEKYNIDYLEEGEQKSNTNNQVENNQSATKKKSVLSNVGLVKRNVSYQNNLDNYNQFIANSKYKKGLQTMDVTKSNHTLHLELANETITDSAYFRFFEFDILASDNSGVYFDNCLIRLAYNTNPFGASAVSIGSVKITKGANFNSTTYSDPNTSVIDQTISVLGIPFGTNFNTTTLNRTLLSATPQQLLHVRLTIDVCNLPANIDFTDIAFTPMFSFYSINANDDITTTISYDNTTYGSAITDELCKPIITYFTPSVATGIGDSIIIQGKYFGANRFHNNGLDSAQIRFRNADINDINNSQAIMQRLDTIDYLYWSDTEIRVSATSLVESEGSSGIGSGKFVVKNKWGDTTMTTDSIRIKYAIINVLLNDIKKRSYLVLDSVGYLFSLPQFILDDTIKIATAEKAIRDWACQTGVKFRVGSTFTNSFISTDNNTSLMSTHSNYSNCDDQVIVLGFGIGFNPTVNWDYDTTGIIASNKYSFYSALIHELGHCHQLDHIINDPIELMKPVIDSGEYRTFSPDLFLGTDDVINFNSSFLTGGCTVSSMIFGSPDCSTNSINENPNEDNFKIYPNPFNYEFTIEFNTQNSDETEVVIYNIIGKIVYQSTQTNQKLITINLDELSKGTYIVAIHTNNKIVSKKLVKTN